MKKILLITTIAITAPFAITSCEEKTPKEEVKDTLDDIGDDLNDGADDIGDEIKDGVEDTKEALKE